MSITPTMEQLAIAVLRGDETAALALADAVSETHQEGGVRLPPVTRLTAEAGRIKVAIFLNPDVMLPDQAELDAMWAGLEGWLQGDAPAALFCPSVSRIEVYEMPPRLDAQPPPPA